MNGKPEPVNPSALIPVGGRNFASMRSAADITAMKNNASIYHQNVSDALLATGKIREDASTFAKPKAQKKLGFVRGAVVKDQKGKKLTIIKASIGYTKETKTPVHRLADSEGNVCVMKETKLKLLI